MQGGHILRPVGVIHHNQIRAVGATDEAGPHRIEHLLDVGRRSRRPEVGRGVEGLGAPEVPRSAVDAANGARGRVNRNLSAEAGDFLAAIAEAIRVDTRSEQVCHRGLGNRHATFQQVDDLFLASILQLLEAGNRDRAGSLLDVVLRGADNISGGNRQGFVAGVVTDVSVLLERQFFHDDVTARERLDVAALFQAGKQGVVLGNVIGNDAGARLNRGCDDVADRGVGEGHD